jgi:hypothetical protein
MNSTRRLALLTCIALGLGIGGCGAARLPQAGPRGPLTSADFYPLGEDYIWTYDIDTGTGLPTLGIRRVVRATPPRFVLQADGDRSEQIYERREEGLWDVQDGVWVLRDPLLLGSEWPSRSGRTARVSAVEQEVDVPAGHFERCIEVTETGSETGPDIRTVYCPGQGPVIVESRQALRLASSGAITVRGVLRSPLQRGLEDVEAPDEIAGPPVR